MGTSALTSCVPERGRICTPYAAALSERVGLIITEITVRDEDHHLWGANATDEHHYSTAQEER